MTLQATETLQNGPFQGIFDEAGAFVGFLNPRANGSDMRIGGDQPGPATFTTLTATTLTVSGQASFADGTAAAPSVKIGDEQNGFYSPSANVLGVTINGIEAARFSSTSATGAQYFDMAYNSGVNAMQLSAIGCNLAYVTGTGGGHLFYTSGFLQAFIPNTSNAVNYAQITGSATGNAVSVSAAGTDANIDFAITPKGTGVLRFGTHSALAAETVTGYITIKDAAGNSRKLAVVS